MIRCDEIQFSPNGRVTCVSRQKQANSLYEAASALPSSSTSAEDRVTRGVRAENAFCSEKHVVFLQMPFRSEKCISTMNNTSSKWKMHFRSKTFADFCQILEGSFSAVSKPIFASKYAFGSSFQALQDLHTFAPLQTQEFSQNIGLKNQRCWWNFREFFGEFGLYYLRVFGFLWYS